MNSLGQCTQHNVSVIWYVVVDLWVGRQYCIIFLSSPLVMPPRANAREQVLSYLKGLLLPHTLQAEQYGFYGVLSRHLHSKDNYLSKLIGSHNPTHVIRQVYTSEHRSPSEHLISLNDKFWAGQTGGHGTTCPKNEYAFRSKPAANWVMRSIFL